MHSTKPTVVIAKGGIFPRDPPSQHKTMSATKGVRNPSTVLGGVSAGNVVPRVEVGGAVTPAEQQGQGIVGRMVAAVQAIQGPMLVSDGIFRDLMSDDSEKAIAIGGHRGMGENLWNDHEPLHLPNLWRENTIKSFLKARQHGVSFVEFDVQVTRDGVPVIWHDDIMTFGSPYQPISTSIRDITLEEFQSVGPISTDPSCQLRELIPLHRDFRSRKTGSKVGGGSNIWRCFDDDRLPTLEDIFEQCPTEMGLNIEVKMTTPATVARTPQDEIDRMVRAILKTVYKCVGVDRKLVLSSFDPDVCLAICESQDDFPVMFISTGGADQHVDPRRMSIEAAVKFAGDNGLAGVVLDTSMLRHNQHCIPRAKAKGLKIMTYGLENDDQEWVQRQSDLGIHAAIVDNVVNVLPKLVSNYDRRKLLGAVLESV